MPALAAGPPAAGVRRPAAHRRHGDRLPARRRRRGARGARPTGATSTPRRSSTPPGLGRRSGRAGGRTAAGPAPARLRPRHRTAAAAGSGTRCTPPTTSPTWPATRRPCRPPRSSRAPPAGPVLIGASRERVGFDRSVSLPALRALAAGRDPAVPVPRRVRAMRAYAGFRPYLPDHLPVDRSGPPGARPLPRVRPRGRRHRPVPGTGHLVAGLLSGARPALDLRPVPSRPLSRGGLVNPLRLVRARPAPAFTVTVDGRRIEVLPGQTVAAALWTAGHQLLAHHPGRRAARAGSSAVSGSASTAWSPSTTARNQRACLVPVRPGRRDPHPGGHGPMTD